MKAMENKFDLPHHPFVVAAGRGNNVEYSALGRVNVEVVRGTLYVDDGNNKDGKLTAQDKNLLALQRVVNQLFRLADVVNQNAGMDARSALLGLRGMADHELFMVRCQLQARECGNAWIELPSTCGTEDWHEVTLFETERLLRINALHTKEETPAQAE